MCRRGSTGTTCPHCLSPERYSPAPLLGGFGNVVRRDGKTQSIPERVGRSAVVPGHSTVQDFLLQKALLKFKTPADQVKIMVLKPPEMIGALRTDQIDAFIA